MGNTIDNTNTKFNVPISNYHQDLHTISTLMVHRTYTIRTKILATMLNNSTIPYSDGNKR